MKEETRKSPRVSMRRVQTENSTPYFLCPMKTLLRSLKKKETLVQVLRELVKLIQDNQKQDSRYSTRQEVVLKTEAQKETAKSLLRCLIEINKTSQIRLKTRKNHNRRAFLSLKTWQEVQVKKTCSMEF